MKSRRSNKYWQRKAQELEYLERFAEPLTDPAPSEDLKALRGAARSLRERILLRQVKQTAKLPETSVGQFRRFELPNGPVAYAYQRYDLRRVDVQWLQEIYFANAEERFSDGLFYSCGMSGIASILAVITRRGWQRVQFSKEGYFESFVLARDFFQQIEVQQVDDVFSSEAEVLWLDTLSPQWPVFPEQRGRLGLIVVDTTCVEPDSERVEQWLTEAARLGCPLVMVRSHLKLDTFGFELGRLGSIVAVAPDDDPKPTEEFIAELILARRSFGAGFHLASLYPWLGDPKFARLARQRTEAIRTATQLLIEFLEAERRPGDRFEIHQREHDIFLVVITNLDAIANETCRENPDQFVHGIVATQIARKCAQDDLPAIAATSFGLDQIAMLDYVNMHDGQHHLRVSGADIPHSYLPKVATHIRQILAQ